HDRARRRRRVGNAAALLYFLDLFLQQGGVSRTRFDPLVLLVGFQSAPAVPLLSIRLPDVIEELGDRFLFKGLFEFGNGLVVLAEGVVQKTLGKQLPGVGSSRPNGLCRRRRA